jgi:hypothetical protein
MIRSGPPIRLLLLLVVTVVAALGATVPATAAAPEPHIRVTTLIPDHVKPGKAMVMFFNIHNDGSIAMNGNVTVRYTFPEGAALSDLVAIEADDPQPNCVQSGQEDECTLDFTGIPPGHVSQYYIVSEVASDAAGILNGSFEVSGGGAPNTVTLPFSLDTAPIGPFDVKSLDVVATAGPTQPASQAGGHPAAITTAFENYSAVAPTFEPVSSFNPVAFIAIVAPENFRNVITHVPPGLVGYPTATAAKCTSEEINTLNHDPESFAQIPLCPRDSQIGVVLLNGKDVSPVYNMVPAAGAPAQFAFYYQGVVINLWPRLRPSDNGIDIVTEKPPSTSAPFPKVEVTLWGSPADSSHDYLRAECTRSVSGAYGILCPTIAPRVPFLRQPTSCTGPLPWGIEMDTYQHPGVFHSKAATSPALTGCDLVPFEPEVSLAPTSSSAHSASGLDVDLTVPQDSAPNGISQADVRKASVTLPQGVGLNPAAAEGLEACADGQLRLGLAGPAECPEASKLGTVEVDTPLLEDPLDGLVYLRTQNSQEPESGQMYRVAIVLHSAERGVDVKLPGSLVVNKVTGQLTTTFDELPQLPFETMHLHLKAGPRAPLTTPQVCGTYHAQATLTGWNGKTVGLEPTFSVDQSCTAPGFSPGFEAGVSDPMAGGFSPFTLRVTRDSGMPNVSRISATLPEGELAKLKGVPVCGDTQAASGACPASSRIGKVTTAVGEGPSPIYLPQPGKAPTAVYLAGPYKGAPYSVVATVPAQSGPFDLGTVTVRSALQVDPTTTQVTVQSDPLPQVFGGILVSYRDVRVEVDRPDFTLNPTDCEPTKVTGTIGSSAGGSADVSDRFQVGDCAALGFKPKLSISLKGKATRTGHPALTAVVTYPKKGDYANIARTSVALPASEFLAQSHIDTSCTRVQYNAGTGGGSQCPKGSVYGRARAFSPLLDRPLEGPVYLRSNGGDRELPDLVASLGGQIHVDIVGYIDSDKKTGGLRTTFAKVPDAPVSKFVLKMPGGRKSLLENSTNICRGRHRAIVKMSGQNGKVHDSRPLVKAKCGKGARKS